MIGCTKWNIDYINCPKLGVRVNLGMHVKSDISAYFYQLDYISRRTLIFRYSKKKNKKTSSQTKCNIVPVILCV